MLLLLLPKRCWLPSLLLLAAASPYSVARVFKGELHCDSEHCELQPRPPTNETSTLTVPNHATEQTAPEVVPRPAPSKITPSSQPPSLCSLYTAPSTIDSSNAGLGIFTARESQRGDLLGVTGGEAVIPVHLDLILEQADHVTPRAAAAAVELLRDYTWDGPRLGLNRSSPDAFVPGLESLVNSHTAAANAGPVVVVRSAKMTAPPMLHTVALSAIPAGGEVFGYYGDHWFAARGFLFDNIDHVPLTKDYEEAEQISKSAYETMRKLKLQAAVQSDLWRMVREWKHVLEAAKVWNALPVSLEDLRQIAGSSMSAYHQAVKADLEQDTTARCVDSIRVRNGNRAYAARDFSAGSVITGSPLLHLVDGTKLLRMPDGSSQPVLQHCFGHDDSTLLLCPYAPGVTSMRSSAARPNVRVQWAPDGHLHHRDAVLKEPAQALLRYRLPVTALDYIAVTDIRAGDELVLDFGHGTASKQDIDKNKRNDEFLEHASYWNHPTAVGAVILRTQAEQIGSNPYPATVALQCHATVLELQAAAQSAVKWTDATALPCQVMERYVDPATAYVTYAVRVFSQGSWNGIGGVPRRHIRFVDVPATAKPMLLPDDVFPRAWRNNNRNFDTAAETAASEEDDDTRENTR